MITEISSHKAQDYILEYAYKNKSKWIGYELIQKDLLPDDPQEFIELLMNKIISTVDPIVEYQKNDYVFVIRANELTNAFLLQGGFTKLREMQLKDLELEQSERKHNIESIKSVISMNKWNKVAILITIIISITSLVISILALLKV